MLIIKTLGLLLTPTHILTGTSTYTPTCTCSRTPSGMERGQARRVVCASARRRQARHNSEPCRPPGQGPEPNPLVDRTLPVGPNGPAGARHGAV